jgi:hypothetical protein
MDKKNFRNSPKSNFIRMGLSVLKSFHAYVRQTGRRTDGRSDFNRRSAGLRTRRQRCELPHVEIPFVYYSNEAHKTETFLRIL